MLLNPYRFATSGGVDLSQGLVNAWEFDGGSGNDTAAHGSVDQTEIGTCGGASTGAPNSSYGYRSAGDPNNNFESASNVMTTSDHSNGIVIAGWFRISNTGDYLFGHESPGGRSRLYMPSSGALRLTFDGLSIGDSSTTGLNDGSWHSFVAASDSTNGGTEGDELWIDGVSESTHSRGFAAGDALLHIGAASNGALEWAGDFCSMFVYDLAIVASGGDDWATAWHNSGSNLHVADL